MTSKERTRVSARSVRTSALVGLLASLAVGGFALGCEVGPPPPETAGSQAMPPPPPPEFVASAAPVDYEGHATYWYSDHWYYRDTNGGWNYYHDEPPALHERRPAQQGPANPGRGAAFTPGAAGGGAEHGGAPPNVNGHNPAQGEATSTRPTLTPGGAAEHPFVPAGDAAPSSTQHEGPTAGSTPPASGGTPPTHTNPHGSAPSGSSAPPSGAPPAHSGGSGHGGTPPSGGSGGEHGGH
jgi:hypothetical protein